MSLRPVSWQKSGRTQPSAPPAPTGAISKNFNTPKQSQFRPRPLKNEEAALNCITCGKKYGLTIFQCSRGHSSCRDCKLNNIPCGICRGPIGDMRNFDIEKYISEVKLAACVAEAERKAPCPNSDDGCTLLLKMADMDAHLKECPYREFVCPLVTLFGQHEPCKWRGKLSQIVSHFDDVHPAHRQGNIDTEMILINILDNIHVVHLIDLTPYIFLVHLKVADEERKIYMTVQLLGTQISASKWSYELHVYNKREPRRKFMHTDVCHSNVVPLEEIFGESKCAAIPQSYALSYINEGCLHYKFYIKRYWGWMSSMGPGELIEVGAHFNSREYIEILRDVMLPSVRIAYPTQEIYFVQDNCSIHRAHIVRQWLEEQEGIHVIDWPSKSPDLNPIENLWGLMTLNWDPTEVRNKENLAAVVTSTWDFMRGRDHCWNMVNGMPGRLEQIVDKAGGSLRY
ncbi:seven in absentia protein family domain-containing protein [Phthorimaea operculella]|nr:seven in absentia protein family domain-containing protein [Phthorimaea operculella]